ncbi:Lipoate-protein ligase A [Smittium culicis]|uniref:Putative lipoate-protein ligase A n=1 Tax=Smittium culicis TaxID=133412 RepID=A0A1R1YHD1_9FUNG|nr:Lipoate-protein ligase A [Smittium culicis]
MPRENFDRDMSAILVSSALNSVGIPATVNKRHDITVDGFKVSGSAYKIIGKKAFHHGTMLINTDFNKLEGCLHSKMNITSAKGIDSVRSEVTNLINYSPEITHKHFSDSVIKQFSSKFGPFKNKINFSDLDQISKIEFSQDTSTLNSYEWLYGQTPEFVFETYMELESANLSLYIKIVVDKGLIKSISINSEIPKSQLIDLESTANSCLQGIKFESSSIASVAENIMFNETLTDLLLMISNKLLE